MPSREIEGFIARWSAASLSERANAPLFLVELCERDWGALESSFSKKLPPHGCKFLLLSPQPAN